MTYSKRSSWSPLGPGGVSDADGGGGSCLCSPSSVEKSSSSSSKSIVGWGMIGGGSGRGAEAGIAALGTAAIIFFLGRRPDVFRLVTRRFFDVFPTLRDRDVDMDRDRVDADLDRPCLAPPEDSLDSRSRCSPKSSIRMHPE